MTLLVRDASLADMAALRAVFRRSALSNAGDRLSLLASPDLLELSDLAIVEGRTRVAVCDGAVVGFAAEIDLGDAIELEDLFVDPDWMGQGAGRALVHDLAESARRRGFRRLEVTANHDAAGFYERVGFVVDQLVQTQLGAAPRMHRDLTD